MRPSIPGIGEVPDPPETTTVFTRCPICGDSKDIVVPTEAYQRWGQGENIQIAMPDMHPDTRERLITGICGDCWEKTFQADE